MPFFEPYKRFKKILGWIGTRENCGENNLPTTDSRDWHIENPNQPPFYVLLFLKWFPYF